ncbi:MAG: cupin domain-containing protein [Flavobacteriales bacterium]|jgi:predicted cupin superfamily sugar epimerase|nr:cupin domain-containing protein [Flavobacteriales bacterium]
MIPEKAQFYIDQLQMLKHPEGGWYKETYRSTGVIPEAELKGIDGPRSYSTGIYFLLTKENFSAFHRINSDEMWHFYDGDGLTIHEIQPNGRYQKHQLGLDLEGVEEPQLVVKGRSWFASEVTEGGSWCLVGCTVSPGFDFRDFEMAARLPLSEEYSDQTELISRLTRS